MTGFSNNGLIVVGFLDQTWKIEVMTKICFDGIAWHNDALVDVDWIVDIFNHSISRQLTMDCSVDIVKQAQVGVCKINLLQPRQIFCDIKKFDMWHFSLLDRIIGPMQRLQKKIQDKSK